MVGIVGMVVVMGVVVVDDRGGGGGCGGDGCGSIGGGGGDKVDNRVVGTYVVLVMNCGDESWYWK